MLSFVQQFRIRGIFLKEKLHNVQDFDRAEGRQRDGSRRQKGMNHIYE